MIHRCSQEDGMSTLAAILTPAESDRLAACEATIERGFQTFAEVGTALLEIRDTRLYRSEFGTFEDYCQQRWNMGRRRAYQLIEAADVVQHVAQIEGAPLPMNSRQAAELVGLPAETAAAVMTAAAEATEGKVTAAAIREAREDIAPRHVITETRTTVETFTVDAETGELVEPAKKPAPSAPRRRPITDAFWEAVYDTGRKVESLRRLIDDDRFTANRAAIADKNLFALTATASTLAEVLAAIENHSQRKE